MESLFPGVRWLHKTKSKPFGRAPDNALVADTGLRIRLPRNRMLLGLPDPDPLVRGTNPDPDHSIIKQK